MKKTIISAILATTFAGMVFAAGAPMASAATNLDTPKQGDTRLVISPGTVTLDTVPSLDYGTAADSLASISNDATVTGTIQVTDLRGAQLDWYVTASAGDLMKTGGGTPAALPVNTISLNVADGDYSTGNSVANIYSRTAGQNTATVAHGGTSTIATTHTGAITSTLTTTDSLTMQSGTYTGNITYTLVDSLT